MHVLLKTIATEEGIPGPKQESIGAMVAGFKSAVTKRINTIRHTPGIHIWQRNYYDHVIRDDNDMNRIREYIINNPINWETDDEYRGNLP